MTCGSRQCFSGGCQTGSCGKHRHLGALTNVGLLLIVAALVAAFMAME